MLDSRFRLRLRVVLVVATFCVNIRLLFVFTTGRVPLLIYRCLIFGAFFELCWFLYLLCNFSSHLWLLDITSRISTRLRVRIRKENLDRILRNLLLNEDFLEIR